MTTTLPSRQQIDRAPNLDFPKPAKQDLTITIRANVDGFDTEICYTGSVEALMQVTKRLRELGASPTIALATVTAPLNGGTQAPRKPATARYADDGTPLCANANCSRSGKPLEPSQHGSGYYCKGKDDRTGNAKGYCKTTAE